MTDADAAVDELDRPGASLSVLAVERGSGDRIAAATPERALAPASNTKLVTAGLALDRLGPGWRYETRVVGPAPDGDGAVDGDLALVGTGAPDLDVAALGALASEVAGRTDRIRGDLVVDGTAFPDGRFGPGWTWGDARYYYGAPSSAVALGRNQLTVTVDTNGTSEPPTVSVSPETPVVEVDPAVTVDAGASTDDLEIYADPDSGAIRLRGSVPAEATPVEESIPIHRPERHAGLALRSALADAGVEIDGTVRVGDASHSDVTVFASVDSAPVRALVREMNVPSDNFVAEQLARTVAHEAAGEGSWSAWECLVDEHFAALDVDTVRVRDGSGLSRYNVVPARGVIAHLQWVDDQPWRGAFFDSLPTPGEGTLASRLDGVDVAAKTGTITGTSALSGVVSRESASDVLFSVLHGGLTCGGSDAARERQNAFVRWLAAEA